MTDMKTFYPAVRHRPAGRAPRPWVAVGTLAAALLLLTAAPSPAADSPTGHLYGRVTTDADAVYVGLLRWGTEEAFWDDHFNSSKEKMPYMGHWDGERKGRTIQIFGRTIEISPRDGSWRSGRQFVSRFGSLESIAVTGSNSAVLTMKGGEEIEVQGGANDVTAKITILDASLGEVEVAWKRIDTVQFLPTPADAEPRGFRLHGTVTTDGGEFRGFIQWDSQESLSYDKLDGEADDSDLSIEMGKIRSIERRSSRSARVVLKDGRELVLSGTNDVNDDIRGVLVEDPRFGRVKIGWDEFGKVVFDDPGQGSGNTYDDYDAGRPLTGTVVDRDGQRHAGRLVFDLDEAWDWEILDGHADDIEYSIPFALVKGLQRDGSRASRVALKSGVTLTLEDTADVSEGNAGILVLPTEGRGETYLRWSEVERVDFGP